MVCQGSYNFLPGGLRANRDLDKKAERAFHSAVVGSVRGPQLKSPCNCLPKTQVSANTKVDV
jgi:hypothetical protein